MRRTPALIVGGGPAGAALAIHLARAGRPHLLIERTRETPDSLCGGFLSWRTVAALEALGVDPFALGGHPVTRLRVAAGGRVAEAALPGRAAGLSRRAMDSALLARVDRVERGVSAREAQPGHVRTADGGQIACDALFLATGKHDLRGLARPHMAQDPDIGLRVRLPPIAAITGVIELHLFDRGYAGLVRQEDGTANLCMAVRRSRLAEAGGDPQALLAALARESPLLGDRMGAGAVGAVQAVANIPYGWRARSAAQGLWRLGDQAGVIPSLAGEGIAIALSTARAAARNYERGGPFQPEIARRLARPMAVAGAVRALAERPSGAALLVALARAMPFAAGAVARLTRVA